MGATQVGLDGLWTDLGMGTTQVGLDGLWTDLGMGTTQVGLCGLWVDLSLLRTTKFRDPVGGPDHTESGAGPVPE
jgi:hypothetical protein